MFFLLFCFSPTSQPSDSAAAAAGGAEMHDVSQKPDEVSGLRLQEMAIWLAKRVKSVSSRHRNLNFSSVILLAVCAG